MKLRESFFWIRSCWLQFLRYPKTDVCCSAQSVAEVNSTLTGMPGKTGPSGNEAMLFLGKVCERLTVLTLSGEEHSAALEALERWKQLC